MMYHVYACSIRNGNSKAIATAECQIYTKDLHKTRTQLKESMFEKFQTTPLNIDLRFINRADLKDKEEKYEVKHINIIKW